MILKAPRTLSLWTAGFSCSERALNKSKPQGLPFIGSHHRCIGVVRFMACCHRKEHLFLAHTKSLFGLVVGLHPPLIHLCFGFIFPASAWPIAHEAPLSMHSPGKNTGVGFHFLLQGIFPNQGSDLGLPQCRQILYHLSHQGSPPPVTVSKKH